MKKKTQAKLKETLEQHSGMESLDRIAGVLDANQPSATPMDTSTTGLVVGDESQDQYKGENKAPLKRSSSKKIKHSLKRKQSAGKAARDKPKRRPRFFAQF